MTTSNLNTHSKSYLVALWTGAALIVILGVFLSLIQFMNSEWLSRSGCLIVMLGIWSGVSGILQERLLFVRTKRHRRNTITAASARLSEESNDTDQTDKELDEIKESYDDKIKEATLNLRMSIGVLEVSLLLTGTFLWGFGDLFFR